MSRLNGRRAQAEAEHLKVNVAILGAGRIAHSMATTLVKMAADPRYAELVAPYAVAARDGERAAAFAAQYGFPVSYGSYEELLADPEVDLVYIATPHSLHAEQGIMCLKAGKNVLVEKSFTANATQARELLAVAKETGLLCTEAIWTRYMPSRRMIDEIVASSIGASKTVTAAARKSTNSSYNCSLEPKYLMIRGALTPASSAMSLSVGVAWVAEVR